MMRTMKILNLYAGIGGNRKLWSADIEVTAVELNPDIAAVYADLYPQDRLIVGDAHQYLVDHYHEYDGVWSSVPCQSHGGMRKNLAVRYRGTAAVYPDMSLYEEIIFLQHYFDGFWVVENVKPYYEPLIPPTVEIHRHLFWSSSQIAKTEMPAEVLKRAQIPDLQRHHGIDLSGYKLPNKRQVLRNCVYPPLGAYVLSQVMRQPTAAVKVHQYALGLA